jgi:hypothetical protein
MALTEVGQWSVAAEVPERDSDPWLHRWERSGIEERCRQAYVCVGDEVLPLYETTRSPIWHGYEVQCGLAGQFGDPIVFAGSPYSLHGNRGQVAAPLVQGAYVTAMEWIARGDAEVLVVPNLTSAGVDSWLDAVGPPVGTVHLERTYHVNAQAPVWMLEGAGAHARVSDVLTVDTKFDEAALHGMLDIPGAMLVTAQGGTFIGFRQGDEVTLRRIEWGADRSTGRDGLRSTELWALVYASTRRPELVKALNRMHATLHAAIAA